MTHRIKPKTVTQIRGKSKGDCSVCGHWVPVVKVLNSWKCKADVDAKAKAYRKKAQQRLMRPKKAPGAIIKDSALRKITLPEAMRAALSEWRRVVRERAGSCCEVCGVYCEPGRMQRGNRLGQSHHLVSAGKNQMLKIHEVNGMYLCSDCHSDFHGSFGHADTGNQAFVWAALQRLRPEAWEYLSNKQTATTINQMKVADARDQLDKLRAIKFTDKQAA